MLHSEICITRLFVWVCRRNVLDVHSKWQIWTSSLLQVHCDLQIQIATVKICWFFSFGCFYSSSSTFSAGLCSLLLNFKSWRNIVNWSKSRKPFQVPGVQTFGDLSDAFFFKFSLLVWNILGAVSQSTYFAVSYSGKLDHMLDRMELNGACATHSRKFATVCVSIAWVMVIFNEAFSVYSLFFAGGDMDIFLTPITTHIILPDHSVVPRVLVFLCSVFNTSAWIFPHAMSFMLASVFNHQYEVLNRSFRKMLAKSDERRLSDTEYRQTRYHNMGSTSLPMTFEQWLVRQSIFGFRYRNFQTAPWGDFHVSQWNGWFPNVSHCRSILLPTVIQHSASVRPHLLPWHNKRSGHTHNAYILDVLGLVWTYRNHRRRHYGEPLRTYTR